MFSPTGLGFGDSILDFQILHYLQESAHREGKELQTWVEWLEYAEQQVRRGLWHCKYHNMSTEAFARLTH
jgi:hypothetical protein